MKILHFADAHIDMANYGRHDPQSGLPMRVLDFLKSLDAIVERAISEPADLVIFAGDAYRDRSPAPTYQREWGKRIMRLSQARIPTLLLTGNHDISPAQVRAHALQEFETLQVPYVRVIDKPEFLGPDQLWGLPLQVIGLPWVTRSWLMAAREISDADRAFTQIEDGLGGLVDEWLKEADPALPVVMAAHASVQGASLGGWRTVTLGSDLVLSGGLVRDPRLSYVALGHIHKPQDLNEGAQPPVVYPGSIERVDFGEANEDRFFVIAHVEKGRDTRVEWVELSGVRKFIIRSVTLESDADVNEILRAALPRPGEMTDAIVRLTVDYPREWDTLIDEPALRKYAAGAFDFQLQKQPRIAARVRLPAGQVVSSLDPLDLLGQYFESAKVEGAAELKDLARDIINPDPKGL